MRKAINITPGLGVPQCKGCERRAVGCHGQCEQYKAFRAECDERKAREEERSGANVKPTHWQHGHERYMYKHKGRYANNGKWV